MQCGVMGKSILVVDDDASQCRCMAVGLRVEGHEVIEAAGGDEALKLAAKNEVDVVVVDLMMPGMNGLELCRVLKERHPNIGLVLTSAYHLSQRQLELAGIGHALFVGKPFTVDRLAGAVRAQSGAAPDPLPSTGTGSL